MEKKTEKMSEVEKLAWLVRWLLIGAVIGYGLSWLLAFLSIAIMAS